MMFISIICIITIVTSTTITSNRPNIIFMFGDDLGYNDVQFTSSDLSQSSTDTNTPNLNKLAREEGIILRNYYVNRMCSPTRAAFLSGRYSFRYGMSTTLLSPNMKVSLTRQVSLLSEEFKLAGYNTHAIGKWHLGYQAWEYTPTYRGFDTFYGYYNAWTDYYESDYNIILDNVEYQYFDLRQDENKITSNNIYSIHRFRDETIDILNDNDNASPFFMYIAWQSSHLPSSAPDRYVNLYKQSAKDHGVELDDSRIYNQAQTTCMDDVIGEIVSVLKEKKLWENTLLVFSSDNGAVATIGDNFPLRGYKKTVFEGGLKVPAFVTGGYLNAQQRGKVIGGSEYFHVTDWYPTLLEAAGIGEPKFAKSNKKKVEDEVISWETSDYTIPLDGISIWNRIQYGQMNDELSSRLIYLDVIVDTNLNCLNGSIRVGKWKYIKGLGTLDDYDGDDGYLWGDKFADISTDAHLWGRHFANLDVDNSLGCDLEAVPVNVMCFYTVEGCLFDLETDPCEMNDVSAAFPERFNFLREKLQHLAATIPTDVSSSKIFSMDIDSVDQWLPTTSGEYWTPWQAYENTEFERVLYTDYNVLYGDEGSVLVEQKIKAMAEMHPRVTVSSSCNDKEDGLYYIKPTVHGEIIAVICSGSYTMLDASLNYDSLSTYFTSMYQYGNADKTIYGTDCSDSAGWRDWYIPANKNTKFRVARDCFECEQGGIHDENTGYYMTNGYFCPVDLDIDGCSDKKDMTGQVVPDMMCNICDDVDGMCGEGDGRTGESINDKLAGSSWCDCYTLQLPADSLTTNEHSLYCQKQLDWRPNLVNDRSQCTCYKPLDIELKIYNDIKISQLPFVSTTYKADIVALGLYIDDMIMWDDDTDSSSDKKTCVQKKTYLSQDDFLYGTYRMTECGNYILTEDIVVNFNKPAQKFDFFAGDSPNTYNMENLPWFPSNQQQESGEYFGLNAFWGPYSIGFMAAITVETDHVYIDLNGFSISMDYEFYLQQRFFALIEFGNKQFEARQGPVDFGRDDLCSKDIFVKDGTLGLSSHHGIHGSCVKNVLISNLNIVNFDVTGLQCNGCKEMTIENCEIGPQNMNIPVKGRYTHGRIMLSRLRYLVDEYGDEPLSFANRNNEVITVQELADTLIEQMDMVYYHIIDGIEFENDNKQWIAAKETFLNPSGWMDGGSSYGILLNGFGTAVVNIGRRITETYKINVVNVEIHNIGVKPFENFWASTSGAIVHGFFFETIDWKNGNVIDENGYYLGDTYTDILFAANKYLSHDFCPLGPLFYMDGLGDWAWTDETSAYDHDIGLEFRCGSDIQSHSAKGAIGIRIDGVQDYSLENIYIHNIVNEGELGSSVCGEYEKITFETGVDVDADIQYGYTGSKVHGILTNYASGSLKNIKIEHLKSFYGSANAIALYKGSETRLNGDININDVIAGESISQEEAEQLILPNPKPFVCSIFIGSNSDSDTNPELTPIVLMDDNLMVTATNLFGYDYCLENQCVGRMGNVNTPQYFVHGDMIFSFNKINFKNTFILGILSIFVVVVIFLFKSSKFKINNNNKSNKLEKRKITTYGSVNQLNI